VISAQIFDPAPTLRELGGEHFVIVAAVEAIYARALCKDPDKRFPDIEAFAAAIAAVTPVACHPHWWRKKTRRELAAAAIVVAGVYANNFA
jgi:hypothetical protein